MKKHLQILALAAMMVLSFAATAQGISLPYFHDFENDETGTNTGMPTGWTRHNDATGTTNFYPCVSSSANAHSGMKFLYFYISPTTTYANNMYAVLPGVNTGGHPMSSLEMLFWAKMGSATSTEKIIVGVMSSPDSVETFVPIDSVMVTGNVMTQYAISFENYTGTNNYIALLVRRGTTCTTAANIYVDDIEVRHLHSAGDLFRP